MNKTNQFSAKTQYVTPSCRSVEFHTQGLVCQSPTYGENGRAGKSVEWGEYPDEF